MATWTKVITADDSIAVAQGGTGVTSFTDGVALTNDTGTSGSVYTYALPAGQMLMGTTGGIPTGGASDSNGDVTFTGETTVEFVIGTDKVTGLHVKDADLTWVTHFATDTTLGNAIASYNASGVPTNLAVGSQGQVLGFDGTNLDWVDTGAATTISIGSSSTNASYGVVFATTADGISQDSTPGDLSYNPSDNKLTAAGGFVGDLTGTADIAKNIDVTDDSGGSTSKKVLFAPTTANVDASGDAGFTYNPGGAGGGTLTVPNLVVSGDTTTLNVQTLEVEDALVTVAINAATQQDAAAAALGAGVEIYVTDSTGATLGAGKLPCIQYAGGSDVSTLSPSGWNIRKYGADDVNPIQSGIATMDTPANATVPTVHVGLGAFHMTNAGGLYIQTA